MDALADAPKLLAGYRRGDPDALKAIYKAYVDDVAALIARGFVATKSTGAYVPGVADYELQCDILQSTFLKAFSETARANYSPQSPFRPYLLRIAKNLLIDRHRKVTREVSTGQRGVGDIDKILEENLEFDQPDPVEQLQFQERLAATREFLGGLDKEAQEFYRLRYVEAIAQRELANLLNLGRRQIRTMEDKLRIGLREALRSKGLWP